MIYEILSKEKNLWITGLPEGEKRKMGTESLLKK